MLPGAPADVRLASSVPRTSPMNDHCPVRTASNHQPAEMAAGRVSARTSRAPVGGDGCHAAGYRRRKWAGEAPSAGLPSPVTGPRFIAGFARVVASGRLRHSGHPGALRPMRNWEGVTGSSSHVTPPRRRVLPADAHGPDVRIGRPTDRRRAVGRDGINSVASEAARRPRTRYHASISSPRRGRAQSSGPCGYPAGPPGP
jgi:hypothetical protein